MASDTDHTVNRIDQTVPAMPVKKLVAKTNGIFFPLFSPEDVCRDKFMQLRKELIEFGCDQNEVISVARQLSMQVLNMKNERDYNNYILDQTYQLSKQHIKDGRDVSPVQDLNSLHYSHVKLFSAIYGFEIEYIKSRSSTGNLADIGCGDGLFLKILSHEGITATGYEIVIKQTRHDVSIVEIKDLTEIKTFHNIITLNHVLEHIDERPSAYLHRLIQHLNSLGNQRVNAVIISLPIHLSLHAHLASDHKWVCHYQEVPEKIRRAFEYENLRFCNPDVEFNKVAEENGYRLTVHRNLGVYVIE